MANNKILVENMQSQMFLCILLASFASVIIFFFRKFKFKSKFVTYIYQQAVQPPPPGGQQHPPLLQGGLHPPPPLAGANLPNANHTCPFNDTLSGIFSAVNNLALTPPFNITPSHNCSGNATALLGQILGGFATLFQNATFAHFLPSNLPFLPHGGLPAGFPGLSH